MVAAEEDESCLQGFLKARNVLPMARLSMRAQRTEKYSEDLDDECGKTHGVLRCFCLYWKTYIMSNSKICISFRLYSKISRRMMNQ